MRVGLGVAPRFGVDAREGRRDYATVRHLLPGPYTMPLVPLCEMGVPGIARGEMVYATQARHLSLPLCQRCMGRLSWLNASVTP